MGGGEPTVRAQPGGPGGPARIGRYQILAELGAGGMGKVYRALDPNLGREVAVKTVLVAGIDGPGARARFDREARALAALRHDNVLAVHDYSGLEVDPVYLVTELIDGEDLGAVLARRGKLSLAAAVVVMREVAAGLGAAHAAGLIHRDVKPANVLVDRRGRVVLADFGVARAPTGPAEAEGSTQSLTFAGTPGYMAPEQIEGRELDGRSDLWALGATAYELLCGERPFGGRNLHEALGRALEGEYRRAVERPEIDPEVALLVDRCLARERERRPRDAGEVVKVLDGVLARLGIDDRRAVVVGEPVGAAAAAGERARRRRWGAVAGGGGVVAALVVGAFWLGRGGATRSPSTVGSTFTSTSPSTSTSTPTSTPTSTVPSPPPPLSPSPSPPPSPSAPPSPSRTPARSPSPPPARSPFVKGSADSRSPSSLTQEEHKVYGALLEQAHKAALRGDHKTQLTLAEKVLDRVESQLALGAATEAACHLDDGDRARRYHKRLTEPNFREATLGLCASRGIYVNEEATSSKWAVFHRVMKARKDGADAVTRGDHQAVLAAARAILAEARDESDRETGHEYAVRAACGLGDQPLAQKHLDELPDGEQGSLIDHCRRKHQLELTR